ncbi:MAG: Helix-turn-helix domain [Candidatus Parcubacteria bacterium]|jgi:excisionase family DNA binding protein
MRYNHKHHLYTVAEVGQILKLSTITIYKYIREKKLEAIEFGRHYRISALSLERFIERHTVPAQVEGGRE